MYKLIFTKEFEKSFSKIKDREDKKRILVKIKELKTNPRLGRMLAGFADPDYGHLYRLRVGKYRVIYSIRHETIEIILLTVGHRKSVYS